jgi:hypothetical protein
VSVKRLVVSAVAVLSLLPARAFADMTKDQCVDANAQAQALRKDGKLSAARDQLRACAAASCPAMVRDDCTRRLDELDKVQPTIVFMAKDAAGQDVRGVVVAVDGATLTHKIDGSELPVDPGEHVFTFTAPGQPPVTKTFVLGVGEKDRREQVLIGGGPPASPTQPAHLVVSAVDGAVIAVDGKVVATGRFDASEAPGPHELRVTAPGMDPYKTEIDLREGETRTLEVSLEAEHHAAVWPWIAGGGALAVGAIVGGYFLFKSSPEAAQPPSGSLGAVRFTSWRLP